MNSILSGAPLRISLALLLIHGWSLAHAQRSAAGVWEFDSSRQQTYIDSVKRSQLNESMSEIAHQMGIARIRATTFELGKDSGGPFFRRKDGTSSVDSQEYVTWWWLGLWSKRFTQYGTIIEHQKN